MNTIEAIKQELSSIYTALDDERVNLVITAAEAILELKAKLEAAEARATMIVRAARPMEHSAKVIFLHAGYDGMAEWADRLQKATTSSTSDWLITHYNNILELIAKRFDGETDSYHVADRIRDMKQQIGDTK